MSIKKTNEKLHKAKDNAFDEFYTQLDTIEKELKYYKEFLNNKIVYCNCDDSNRSQFVKFFKDNFKDFNLKKLIACHKSDNPHVYIFDGIVENIIPISDGDFRKQESINYLIESDVVITNPPFSLFVEFFNLMLEHKKDFIVLSNLNAITYIDVFRQIKQNKVFLGKSIKSGGVTFEVPNELVYYSENVTNKQLKKYISLSIIRWFTNINLGNTNRKIILTRKYNPNLHKKYDNFDAINVDYVKDIPFNYSGIMGVPITFLDKYNPDQFEILGVSLSKYHPDISIPMIPGVENSRKSTDPTIDGKYIFKRIFIKNKKPLLNLA